MNKIILFAFLGITLNLSSQNAKIDSLEQWSYDVLNKNEFNVWLNDSSLISVIVIYRNQPLDDLRYDEVMAKRQGYRGTGLRPNMIFYIYPLSMLVEVKSWSALCKMTSSCTYPNVGGDYFVLQDFIFFNHVSCVQCSHWDNQIDLCRKNIENIFKQVENIHFNSFEEFCEKLPIKKEKFYN